MEIKIKSKFDIGDLVVLRRDLGKEDALIMQIEAIHPQVYNQDRRFSAVQIWYVVYHNGTHAGTFLESDLISERHHHTIHKICNT